MVDLVGGDTLARSYAVGKRGGVLATAVQPIDELPLPLVVFFVLPAPSFGQNSRRASLAREPSLCRLVSKYSAWGLVVKEPKSMLPISNRRDALKLVRPSGIQVGQVGHTHTSC